MSPTHTTTHTQQLMFSLFQGDIYSILSIVGEGLSVKTGNGGSIVLSVYTTYSVSVAVL